MHRCRFDRGSIAESEESKEGNCRSLEAMSSLYQIAPSEGAKRDAKFYRDLAEDARMLAAHLQDEVRSTILEVAAAFACAAAALDMEERGGIN